MVVKLKKGKRLKKGIKLSEKGKARIKEELRKGKGGSKGTWPRRGRKLT